MLRDPVTTTMLRDGLIGVTEVVIHELSHARLFVPGHTAWNEALASFVGERGAERYFEQQRFAHSALRQQMRERAERRRVFDAAVADTYAALERLYASAESEAYKLEVRQRAFEQLSARMAALLPADRVRNLSMNNARLVHLHRYGASNGLLSDLWKQSGSTFRGFWALAERYARTEL
jgi:predicted aminopeptidase